MSHFQIASHNQDLLEENLNLQCRCEQVEKLDQHQYLGNCLPTPPLTQQQSIDNKLGLMLG